jgi:hypothetical protein
MAVPRHCRHCWGNCAGDCLIAGQEELCIHGWARKPPPLSRRLRLALWKLRRTMFR